MDSLCYRALEWCQTPLNATRRRLSALAVSISREMPKDCPRGLSFMSQSTLDPGWGQLEPGDPWCEWPLALEEAPLTWHGCR